MSLAWEVVLLTCGANAVFFAACFVVALAGLRWLRANPLHVQRLMGTLMQRMMRF